MVKTAEAWQRSQTGIRLDWTSAGCVFAQGIVNAVVLAIADVLADDATKVFLIQRDDVVRISRRQFPTHLSTSPLKMES